jgi:NMD protein affecting ribosome stability and mRNA decay
MSFLKCSFCGQRCVAGACHVYWFAPSRTGDVFRVRQRLCEDCLATNVVALLTPEDQEELTCSACGIDVEQDVYPIYVTWFVKQEGATRGAMALCEEHALELPDRYVEAPDRVVASAGPARDVFLAVGRPDPGIKHGPSRTLPTRLTAPPNS